MTGDELMQQFNRDDVQGRQFVAAIRVFRSIAPDDPETALNAEIVRRLLAGEPLGPDMSFIQPGRLFLDLQ